MALQMQNAFSADVAEFSRFDRMQGVLARPKPVEHIITGGIARMNSCALIPVPAIYFDVVGHANSLRYAKSRAKVALVDHRDRARTRCGPGPATTPCPSSP